MMKLVSILFISFLSACSIQQTVRSVDISSIQELCIERNPKVRRAFLAALDKEVTEKGVKTRVVKAASASIPCNHTMTYTANWGWDVGTYLKYAEMKVFSNGKQVGECIYDARSGGGRLDKFISADDKVREMVNLLFVVPPGK